MIKVSARNDKFKEKRRLLSMMMGRRLKFFGTGQFADQCLRFVNQDREALRANPLRAAIVAQVDQGDFGFGAITVDAMINLGVCHRDVLIKNLD
jgi:hypothetical protein